LWKILHELLLLVREKKKFERKRKSVGEGDGEV
jgi:hypothetical protein